MKWFRMYSDALDDDKLRLLAFEDRWHFTAVLCMKSSGLLDEPLGELRDRRISVKLGLTLRECDEVRRRLFEVDLIDANWQPIAWERRQYEHDSSAARTRAYRERKAAEKQREKGVLRHSDVTVTTTEAETEAETDKSKSKRRFTPPSPKEVSEYVATEQLCVDPILFITHYQSVGWLVGKSRMKDWRAAARGWHQREEKRHASNQPGRSARADTSAAGRVRANVKRELDTLAAARAGGDGVAAHVQPIRPQVG